MASQKRHQAGGSDPIDRPGGVGVDGSDRIDRPEGVDEQTGGSDPIDSPKGVDDEAGDMINRPGSQGGSKENQSLGVARRP